MLNLDEDALVCDLAEVYHVLDMRSLPVKLVATLSAGLRDNSRIKLRLADMPVTQEVLLLATIADRVEMFRYGFTDGKHTPQSIVESIYESANKDKGVKSFKTVNEFEAALARIKGE